MLGSGVEMQPVPAVAPVLLRTATNGTSSLEVLGSPVSTLTVASITDAASSFAATTTLRPLIICTFTLVAAPATAGAARKPRVGRATVRNLRVMAATRRR
jgi:hypothetical protein